MGKQNLWGAKNEQGTLMTGTIAGSIVDSVCEVLKRIGVPGVVIEEFKTHQIVRITVDPADDE